MIFNTKLLRSLKHSAKKYGLNKAILKLLKDLRVTSISRKGDLPKKGPVLVISDHPGVFDSMLLMSQIDRDDAHMIAISTYGIFGPEVQKKLLPIYRARSLNHKVYEYPLFLQVDGRLPPRFHPNEMKARNRRAISKAARLINSGKIVSMFPAGTVGKPINGGKWKAGVGFLIKQITNPKTKMVFAKIKGTGNRDLLAYLHPILSRIFFWPRPISIQFSRAWLVNDLVNREDDGKTISMKLEKLYENYHQ